MLDQLQVRLFGSPQFLYKGQAVSGFLSVKVRALLIFLAVTGRPHSRDALAELLWAENANSARNNVKKALSNLRQIPGIPLVEDANKLVSLDRQRYELDVADLERCAENLGPWANSQNLESAIELYQGDFLAGFNVSLSPEFESWALSVQSRLRTQMASLLRYHAATLEAHNALSQATSVLRRLAALEPWAEDTHRQLMVLLTKQGQHNAALLQYELCKQVLADEVGVAPEPETTALYEQISRDRRNSRTTTPQAALNVSKKAIAWPSFLKNEPAGAGITLPFFVGRENELAALHHLLDLTLAGQGQVGFVAGDAGSGKTSLVREFLRQSLVKDESLVAIMGNCSAYGGLGDPYLPFRETLALLTGDVEAHWRAGTLTFEHARRLWALMPRTLQVLSEVGLNLIDIFVPATALRARAALAMGAAAPVPELAEKPPANVDQLRLFETITAVLHAVANHAPIILVLEDLQWADSASISLLFHLGRSLSGQRIMLLGTYRSHEVASRRDAPDQLNVTRHPLEPVVLEFQRRFGNMVVDLEQVNGRDFVASIVDAGSNHLDARFREKLFLHTRGHALFTTEVLRGLQVHGDLVQDEQGYWVAAPNLDWQRLPGRVEGVIKERISRLPPRLYEICKVASVMGEEFAAEVIARVLQLDARDVVQWVGSELDRVHHLIIGLGSQRVADHRLSHYRFRHILFQHYLYQTIDTGERAYLHEDTGYALEQLYQGQTEEIAVQLVRHFRTAGVLHKTIEYLEIAGHQASRSYAHREAIDFYADALVQVASLPESRERWVTELRLRMALAESQWNAGSVSNALASYQTVADIARSLNLPDELARAALGYEQVRYRFNLPVEPSVALLAEARAVLGDGDSVLKANVLGNLFRTMAAVRSPALSITLYEEAIALAHRLGDASTLFDVIYVGLVAQIGPLYAEKRLSTLQYLRSLIRQIGDRVREASLSSIFVANYLELGDIQAMDAALEEGLTLADELRLPFSAVLMLAQRAMRLIMAGRYEEGEQSALQAFNVGKELQIANADGAFGIQMFTIRREQGRLGQLVPIMRQFVESRPDTALWRPGLALMYCELGFTPEAKVQFNILAEGDFSLIPLDALWHGSIAYLAEVCAYLEDSERAATLYSLLLPYAEHPIVVGFAVACLGAASRFLGLLAATMHNWAVAARHFEHALMANERLGAWPALAHVQHEYARMLFAWNVRGNEAKAFELLNAALGTARALKMSVLIAQLESMTSGRGVEHASILDRAELRRTVGDR